MARKRKKKPRITKRAGAAVAPPSAARKSDTETETESETETETETETESESETETESESETGEQRRSPGAGGAAFLSVIVPGAGQVYAGARTRGVMWLAVPAAVVLLCAALAPQLGPWPLLVTMLGAGIVPRILSPADAYLVAKRSQAETPPGIVVILGLMGLFAGNRAVANLIDSQFYGSFGAMTHAMTPSFLAGDQLFIDRRAYSDREPQPGEVVLVGDAESPRLMRMVARRGDVVEQREGHLYINQAAVPRCPVGEVTLHEETLPVHLYQLGTTSFLAVDDGETLPPTTVHADLGLWTDGVAVGVLPEATEPSVPRFETRGAGEVQGRPWTIFWSFPPPGESGTDRTARVGLIVDGPSPVTEGLPAPMVERIGACTKNLAATP